MGGQNSVTKCLVFFVILLIIIIITKTSSRTFIAIGVGCCSDVHVNCRGK